jgi:carbonic anhydrase
MVLDVPAVVQKRYTVVPLSTDFIPSLGQPKANILWIGCSDSWITETSSLDVLPDETFVHRNLGAVVSNDDLSSQSAIAYSVELLKVGEAAFDVGASLIDCVIGETYRHLRPL